MNKTACICLASLVFAFAVPIYAEAPLTLETALLTAINNNPGIKVYEEAIYAKKMDKRTSVAKMLPNVEASYGYARLKEEPTFSIPSLIPETWLPVVSDMNPPNPGNLTGDYAYVPTIPAQELVMGTKDNYEFSVEVTQPLFTGGALWNSYKIAKNDMLVATIDKQKAVRDLKLRVIETYYGVIEVRHITEVAKSGESSIQAHLNTAEAFYKQGMIPKNDLLEAQVRHAEAKQNLIMAENAVKIAESGFNILLARDLSEPVIIENEIPMETFNDTLDACIQKALKDREEIRVLDLQRKMAKGGVNIARSAFMPMVAASYTYEKTGEDPDVNEDDTWTAGVGFTWNLFEGGSQLWQLSKAKSQMTQLDYLNQTQRDQITLEVKTSYLYMKEAEARTNVAIAAIDQANENLRIQKDRYNLQVATSTDVLDAQTLLDKAKKNYISARADYAKGIAKLRAATGSL